ncbi:MAG: transcriptional regulator, LysR family [Firmicutes bacterium]|nr:transcriptional regulator, LysR family [Bacillota bacterium]
MFKGKEYIYEVYKEKSFSKAAQNLYISQPALSAAIKKIERRLDCCIFDRSSNPVQLTEAGTEYVKSIEKIMDIENRNYPLNELIYEKHLFCRECLILTVPQKFSSNSLAQEYQLSIDDIRHGIHLKPATKPVPLSLFAHDPFIFLRAGNDTRMRADKIFQENSITPKIILELDQLATAYNIACYGMGITIISDTLAQKASYDSNMLYYKINSTHTFRNVFFYNKQNKYITKAMDEFIKIAQKTDGKQ